MYDCVNDDIGKKVIKLNDDYIEQVKNDECYEKVPFRSWCSNKIKLAILTFILVLIIIFVIAFTYEVFFEIRHTVGA